jgi:hypothetical protein
MQRRERRLVVELIACCRDSIDSLLEDLNICSTRERAKKFLCDC